MQKTATIIAASALLVGCLPQTLWFEAPPPLGDGTRTFRLERSEALFTNRSESEIQRELTEMAEFWSKRENVCLYGVVPTSFGWDSAKKRYWVQGRCAVHK